MYPPVQIGGGALFTLIIPIFVQEQIIESWITCQVEKISGVIFLEALLELKYSRFLPHYKSRISLLVSGQTEKFDHLFFSSWTSNSGFNQMYSIFSTKVGTISVNERGTVLFYSDPLFSTIVLLSLIILSI